MKIILTDKDKKFLLYMQCEEMPIDDCEEECPLSFLCMEHYYCKDLIRAVLKGERFE